MAQTIKKKGSEKEARPRIKVTKAAVRKRAYEIYQKRDPEDGSPYDDWLKAEDELMPNPEY